MERSPRLPLYYKSLTLKLYVYINALNVLNVIDWLGISFGFIVYRYIGLALCPRVLETSNKQRFLLHNQCDAF